MRFAGSFVQNRTAPSRGPGVAARIRRVGSDRPQRTIADRGDAGDGAARVGVVRLEHATARRARTRRSCVSDAR